MVELIPLQGVDLLHPAQGVDPGQLGGGDAGHQVPVHEEGPVQAEALQHHLVPHDAGIVEEEAVAQVAVGAHHGEQAL